MVFSLRARPRPHLHNYRKEETDGGGSGQASDYENRPDPQRLDSLADQVCRLTGLEISGDIYQALELNKYSAPAAADYLMAYTRARARIAEEELAEIQVKPNSRISLQQEEDPVRARGHIKRLTGGWPCGVEARTPKGVQQHKF